MKELVNKAEVDRILDRLSFQIAESCPDMEKLYIVGIHRRGVPLANRLRELIKKHHGVDVPMGTLDITLYRDDLTEVSTFPTVYSTQLDTDINKRTLILVDDVIYTGRTVRAALEAILTFGRPTKVLMMALVDRGHRELPIQADFIGKVIPTSQSEFIEVRVKEIDTDKEEGIFIGERKK